MVSLIAREDVLTIGWMDGWMEKRESNVLVKISWQRTVMLGKR